MATARITNAIPPIDQLGVKRDLIFPILRGTSHQCEAEVKVNTKLRQLPYQKANVYIAV